jgi:hypothetical protein
MFQIEVVDLNKMSILWHVQFSSTVSCFYVVNNVDFIPTSDKYKYLKNCNIKV